MLIDPLEPRTLFAALPAGFTDSAVASGLNRPVAVDVAPDGRLFVTEQSGAVRVIREGVLLPTPFVKLDVNFTGERGADGITLDPNFATNHFVYVFHTARAPTLHNRVSRFTADGDVAVPGSETVIFDLDRLDASSAVHNGGGVHFGADGKLYIAAGENNFPDKAQSLTTTLGKVLRVNPDGSIPTDNPFYAQTTGNNRAIYALGFRNPFTFDIERSTGRTFINDVGAATWEEIDPISAGDNCGWPREEGTGTDPAFRQPLYADGCTPWIWRLDRDTGAASPFATDIGPGFGLTTGADGSLYYVAYNQGQVRRVSFATPGAPVIANNPVSQSVAQGRPVTFSITASGQEPLAYQWQRDGVDIPGATGPSYTIDATTAADNGAAFRAVVSNASGSATSAAATLTVVSDTPPVPVILTPREGSLYSAGTVLRFKGIATDAEDGRLRPSAFSWRIDFHHDEHLHPFFPDTPGKRAGKVRIPDVGETSTNVWYRVHLTVTDSAGVSSTTFRDVHPRVVTLTATTTDPGLSLNLDGQPAPSPLTFTSVVGLRRTLEAPATQVVNNQTYTFRGWNGSRKSVLTLKTPRSNHTFTARYA